MLTRIGDRIKTRRMELGWNQRDLAEKMGYKNHSAVARAEAGKVDLPQSKVEQFAKVLGVKPGYLMGWEEKPEEFGALAAEVLKDPQLIKLVQEYRTLDATDRDAVSALVSSLSHKKKTDV